MSMIESVYHLRDTGIEVVDTGESVCLAGLLSMQNGTCLFLCEET